MGENIIVLKSAYNKTQGQVYFIQPCIDPATGMYPSCVREVEDPKTHKMILSEDDKKFLSRGGKLIPASMTIKVQHGTTFNLDDPAQAAQWEAIKNSPLIAPDRLAKDNKGNYIVDGERPYMTDTGMIRGRYGSADLYVEHPGSISKNKNNFRKLVLKAQNFINDDTFDGWIIKCKLLEKNMAHANVNDVEDYLMTQAEKYPEKIIELYTGTKTSIRLLLIEAIEKNVVIRRSGILYYADDVVLGGSLDHAVDFLSSPENVKLKELIQRDTFPDMFKAEDKAAAKTTKK